MKGPKMIINQNKGIFSPYNENKSQNEVNALNELKQRSQWLNFILYPKPGGFSKPPINPVTLWNGSTTSAKSWADYTKAVQNIGRVARYKTKDGKVTESQVAGVGFVMTGGYCGIDLDHVVDSRGNVPPFVSRLINTMDTYTELSPSKTGLHLILFDPDLHNDMGGKFKVDANGRPNKSGAYEIEIYAYKVNGGRYLTVTGNVYKDRPINRTKGAKLREIYDFYKAREKAGFDGVAFSVGSQTPQTEDDKTVLDKAFNSRSGQRIKELYQGNLRSYNNDHSAGDQAFINDLAYWTNGNREQMDRIFRCSGLMRNKWDERHYTDGATYGEYTIAKALQNFRPWTPGQGFTKEQRKEYGRKLHKNNNFKSEEKR